MANDTVTPQTERLLVCLGPGPFSAGLLNAARKMAADLKAQWFVLFVEDRRRCPLRKKRATVSPKICVWPSNGGPRPLP